MTSHYGQSEDRYSSPFLLALHSSSEQLGVAVMDIRDPLDSKSSATFQVGRELSKNLLSCVEELLPISLWKQLGRLAVATGPGGFTGTRLTVVMARTLAQQLDCQLDGISSFALMAPRLALSLPLEKVLQPFWIVQALNRRGTIGGLYQLQLSQDLSCGYEVLELEVPHLLPLGYGVSPALVANDDVASDVEQLLELSALAHRTGHNASWNLTLPLYPTSPVGNH